MRHPVRSRDTWCLQKATLQSERQQPQRTVRLHRTFTMIRLSIFLALVTMYSASGVQSEHVPSDEKVTDLGTHNRFKRAIDWAAIVKRGKWQSWTQCNKPCGSGGRQSITKICKLPERNVKMPCRKIEVTCNEKLCDSPFFHVPWSKCEPSCDLGERHRTGTDSTVQTISCGVRNCKAPLVSGKRHHSIVFVLDSSASDKGENAINWEKMKSFVAILAQRIDLQKSSLGMVSFANMAAKVFGVKKDSTSSEVEEKIMEAPFLAGCSNPADGVKMATKMLKKLRNTVRSIVILVDGRENVVTDNNMRKSTAIAKRRGISTVAVGIGPKVDTGDLKAIGRRRGSAKFMVPGYDELPFFVEKVLKAIYD